MGGSDGFWWHDIGWDGRGGVTGLGLSWQVVKSMRGATAFFMDARPETNITTSPDR